MNAFEKTNSVIPGWSFSHENNSSLPIIDDLTIQNNALQNHLITWNEIESVLSSVLPI